VFAAGAASAALTGCGDGTDDSSAPIVRAATAATSADTGPYADLTGEQVLDQARDTMSALSSFTMDMHAPGDSGEPMRITASLTDTGGCLASIDDDGSGFQVIGTGDVYYVKGDAAFWQAQGGSDDPDLAQALDGKWLKVPASLEADGFDTFCDLTGLVSTMVGDSDGTDLVSKGRPTLYAGAQVIPLTVQSSDGDSIVDVAATGEPYVLAEYAADDSTEYVAFSGFGKTLAITAPPADQTVDISQFGDLPGFSV